METLSALLDPLGGNTPVTDVEQTVELQVTWDNMTVIRRHCNAYTIVDLEVFVFVYNGVKKSIALNVVYSINTS